MANDPVKTSVNWNNLTIKTNLSPEEIAFNIGVNKIVADSALSVNERIIKANAFAQQNNKVLNQDQLKVAAQAGLGSTQLGIPPADPLPATIEEDVIVVTGSRSTQARTDHRIRISAPVAARAQIYGPNNRANNILYPLWRTDGLVFPYTPTIQMNQDVSWQQADLEHANYDILSFQKSSSANISLTGKFTVQNQREGEYLLAAIHFLRTVSKSYFGSQDVEKFEDPTAQTTDQRPETSSAAQIEQTRQGGRAGLPPPVLYLSGYGTMMFNDIPVVIRSHSWSYDETADLIHISLGDGRDVWLPPMMTISITLSMQQNTDKLRDDFSLDQFRSGELLKKGGWF